VLRRLLGPALLITVAAFSGTARAEDAQALFDEGLSDMRAGRFKIGCALIKQSLEIDARPGTLFTLAECYSKAGKYASAVEHYDRYLSVFEGMPADQQQSQEARADLSRSERTRLVALVAWLRVSVPDSAPPGIVATMDGEPFPAGLFGAATAVDPGPHVFTTRAPDGPLVEQRIDIAPGERRSLILALRTSSSAPPQPPVDPDVPPPGPGPDQQPKHGGVSPWVWVAGGVGAAGLITGGITGAMLLNARSTILRDCPNHSCPNTPAGSEGMKAVDRAPNTLAPATTVALSVGAAGLITAIVLLVTDDGGSSPTRGAIPTVELGPGLATLGVTSPW
jgi:hypothetical protein